MKAIGSNIVVCATLLIAPASYAAPVLPGTPLSGGNFGTIDISDGLTILPGLVQEGDVILRENPQRGNLSDNWSDAVRFFNFLGFGAAYHISDGETGIPSLLVADAFDNPILPNALSSNSVFINEVQIGTGNDELDVTPYAALSTVYRIHSDAPLPSDVPDFFILQPGAEVGPGKKNRIITLFEAPDDRFPQTAFVPFTVINTPPGGAPAMPPDGEDTLTFAPAIQNGINGTLLTLTSVFENDASDDLEPINVRGDEITTAYAIRSVDPIPEPSTWIILVTSLITLVGYFWSRKPECVRPA